MSLEYPVWTAGGVAYQAPVEDFDASNDCAQCPHRARCLELVAFADGFALCEPVLACDFMPPQGAGRKDGSTIGV